MGHVTRKLLKNISVKSINYTFVTKTVLWTVTGGLMAQHVEE